MDSFKKFEINKYGRDFVIGDLHGCYDEFIKILEQLNFDKSKDRMFSVGDLIDRGSDSEKCLGLIHEKWFHSVLGNHEQMLIDSTNYNSDIPLHIQNGGGWIFNHYHFELRLMADDCKSLPLAIEVETDNGNVGIVHAEFPNTINDWNILKENIDEYKDILTWSRQRITNGIKTPISNIHFVISGHTPQNNITQLANHLWIDLGGVYYGRFGIVQIQPIINQLTWSFKN